MFRCERCLEVIGPGIAPHVVPRGFRTGDTEARGQRIGEARLCSACVLGFKQHEAETVLDAGCFRYAYLEKS